jgi:hypothetical protein
MIISKKAFLANIGEWCWVGNGRCDLKDEDGAFIPEPVCETYTKWINEWVERFNTTNDGFKLKLVIVNDEYSNGYRLERITPKRIMFPKWDDIEEEEYALTEKEAEEAGEVSEESNINDE